MHEYSRRREVLVRIAELLEQMPEDVLHQLIQRWETELNQILVNDPNDFSCDEHEAHASDKTLFDSRHKLSIMKENH